MGALVGQEPSNAPALAAPVQLPDARLLRSLVILSKHLLSRSDGGRIVRIDIPACSTPERRCGRERQAGWPASGWQKRRKEEEENRWRQAVQPGIPPAHLG